VKKDKNITLPSKLLSAKLLEEQTEYEIGAAGYKIKK